MDRKAVAKQTVAILDQGYYDGPDRRVNLEKLQARMVADSVLVTPEQGEELLKNYPAGARPCTWHASTWNCATVEGIERLAAAGKPPAVLNFASAKNPGGGFLNGAMAQEESLAASSSLYQALLAHETYYRENRACGTMMYTDYAIFAPGVPFFRDGQFALRGTPVLADVLTLPAVNMGQVILKGEDPERAKAVMLRRMKLALALFARQGCRHLVLGAYGCGVFRNDPDVIAAGWSELLHTCFQDQFETVIFAVLDHSKTQRCIKAFQALTEA